ncbi:MAG: RND transporter [Candidatus Neomarinimicrobiota bacterium]|nr:MAG: RND transporter [Candidatus Neomarinimicrobiota bacterium]
MKKKLIAGLVVLAGIVLYLNPFSSNGDGSIEVSTMKMERKDLSSKVVADGELQPEIEIKLSANNTTYITDIAVKEGDFVKKGDFLMALDDRQQRAATEASRASVKATSVQLEQRKSQKSRQEELYKQGLISDQEMETTNSSYASALSSYNQAKARLIQDEDALQKLKLVAPQDGTITYLTGEVGDLAQGGMFNPQVLIKLSDLSKMEVLVNVNENDITDVSLNDYALVEVDAYQDRKFKGVVKEVAYAASTSSGGSQQQVTNFQVKVQMLEVADGMRPGMSAAVDIVTENREQVLTIPIQSLTSPRQAPDGESKKKSSNFSVSVESGNEKRQWGNRSQQSGNKGRNVVFVVKGNTVEQRFVETGIVGDVDYEIISGLEEGEEIVVGGFVAISRDLYNGAKVTVKEKSNNNSRSSRKRG